MADALPTFPVNAQRLTDKGRYVELIADANQRNAIARHAGLSEIRELKAKLHLSPFDREGVNITGTLHADVEQPCVVTLEPVGQEVDVDIDMRYLPREKELSGGHEIVVQADEEDPPEYFEGAAVDVWAAIIESLILNVDLFPRVQGAEIDAAAIDDDDHEVNEESPFAALENWKSGVTPRK